MSEQSPGLSPTSQQEPERRRRERRVNARIADLTLPELRRLLVTTLLATIVVGLFLFMVREVIVAGVLGVIIGVYLKPLYHWLLARTNNPPLSALLTIGLVILPVLGALIYSFSEKLAALLDLELVAKLTLQEARQMIVAKTAC